MQSYALRFHNEPHLAESTACDGEYIPCSRLLALISAQNANARPFQLHKAHSAMEELGNFIIDDLTMADDPNIPDGASAGAKLDIVPLTDITDGAKNRWQEMASDPNWRLLWGIGDSEADWTTPWLSCRPCRKTRSNDEAFKFLPSHGKRYRANGFTAHSSTSLKWFSDQAIVVEQFYSGLKP